MDSVRELSAKYSPAGIEDKWYRYWLEKGFFSSTPDEREPYCIVIPPPNVTGVLHMGHMLNNTLQDVLIRRARLMGKNACWVPGTDHASIATEAKVVAKLKADGIEKSQLSREEFLKHAWEWKEKHGGIILEQLKKLGASCDWSRTRFTMDETLSASVIHVFVDLFNKGYIYRGVRMVNWDPQAKTAVSDEEVVYREVKGKLYFVRYRIEGEDSFVTIATTRPETILGDTALCVHPDDPRYTHLKGKRVIVPLVNRSVPIIYDEYVDREFGTGALKITPAHDVNDYLIGQKHNLDSIDIFNDDGTISPAAKLYVGLDRFEVRRRIVDDLKSSGNLERVDDYVNSVGFSERTDAIIEPKLSMQWFLRMKELAEPALKAVVEGDIQLYPPKFVNTYRHWMENVKDWCLSRQLWWGHRIPAWYLPNGGFVVAHNVEEAVELARKAAGNSGLVADDLRQDEDVLDTWFSSWLWPISVFNGILEPNNPDIRYYYPTNDLVTAPEILFFWVARMIMAGYEYMGDKPFRNVYLTGIVRDHLHRKMSKQLGNSPDPLKLIEKYGADGVRVGMLLCSPAGNDLLFDENLTEQGRNFCNKIWNAFRLVKGWQVDESAVQPQSAIAAIEWFNSLLNKSIEQADDDFAKYRISEALMNLYKLFWDDFASWYLEIIKPAYGKPVDAVTYNATVSIFEKLLIMLHPFMPFITEELWQHIRQRGDGESIMVQQLPHSTGFNQDILIGFDRVKEVVVGVRNIRQENNISPKQPLQLSIRNAAKLDAGLEEIISKLASINSLTYIDQKIEGAATFMVGTTEIYIPLGGLINTEEEREKILSELEYTKGFLEKVMKKLNNERFTSNAPKAVVELEHKKQADALAKIEALQERLKSLG